MAKRQRPTRHPALTAGQTEFERQVQESLEILLGRRGQNIDRAVTFRDLEDAGLVRVVEGAGSGTVVVVQNGAGGGDGGTVGDPGGGPLDFGEGDTSLPPAPTGVRARGLSVDSIGVTWDPPAYNNHAYAEIFASQADNWDEIVAGFNANQPVGPNNSSPYFMGTGSFTQFLHTGLSSTVPTLDLTAEIGAIVQESGQFRVTVDDGSQFVVGETVYLSSPSPWDANGQEGAVLDVVGNDVVVAGTYDAGAVPTDALLVRILEEDDLDAALNPTTIYYWVRFVSTAGVAGPVQSNEGVPGTVQVNPTEILNILTGRIRSAQLSNELLAPINWISGPIGEFDSVFDFVVAQGGALLTEYDETLEQVILGVINAGNGGGGTLILADADLYQRLDAGTVDIWTDEGSQQVGEIGDTVIYRAGASDPVAGLDGVEMEILDINPGGTGRHLRYTLEVPGTVNPPGLDLQTLSPTGDLDNGGSPIPNGGFEGLAAAAAYLVQIQGEVNDQGAFIQSLETLQAGFQEGTVEGVVDIIATVVGRQLVQATDEGALAYIVNNAQAEYGDETLVLNEVAQRAFASEERLESSITLRVQADQGGVLTTAGFGIGLEGDANDPDSLVSTFAVQADQFAVMSGGNQGRRIFSIQSAGARYVCQMDPGTGPADALIVGENAVIAFPESASSLIKTAFRGRTFEITARPNTTTIELRAREGDDPLTNIGNQTFVDAEGRSGYAMFPEQNVPFIIDTARQVVAIRGRLIVDGMITATDAEITGLLTANEIWARNLHVFGVAQADSLVGRVMATPRFGGWAVRIQAPNAARPRVIEFGRWFNNTDAADPEEVLNDASNFPQLVDDPQESAFWLDSDDGSVYVRGNLTVGRNARIWTGDYQGNPGDWFVQMDQRFPFLIFPRSLNVPGIPSQEGGAINWNPAAEGQARLNALMYASADGYVGFNTANGGIYVNGNPLDAPNGDGKVRVLERFNPATGFPIGLGRVYGTMGFTSTDNSNGSQGATPGPENVIGYSVVLCIAPDQDYFQFGGAGYELIRPSQRIGTGGITNINTQFMDEHFVIVRPTTADPGTGNRLALQSFLNNAGLNQFTITEYFAGSGNREFASGTLTDIPASTNYKLLVICAERFWNQGNTLIDSSTPSNVAMLPYSATPFVQQVATVPAGGTTTGDVNVRTPGETLEPSEKDDRVFPPDAGGGGITTIAAATDTDFTALAAADLFQYDGSDWVNVTLTDALETALGPTTEDALPFYDDSTGEVDWLTIGQGLEIDGTELRATGGSSFVRGVAWYSDSAITAAAARTLRVYVPEAVTISSVALETEGGTGDVEVDIQARTLNGAPSSIVASAPPAITGGTSYSDSTLTGWTTSVAAGTVLEFSITSTDDSFTLIRCLLTVTPE